MEITHEMEHILVAYLMTEVQYVWKDTRGSDRFKK